jgi:hypothetical protein
MKGRLVLLVVCGAAVIAAAAVSPAGATVAVPKASAKTCYRGYVHANFPWGERCIRAGQFCKLKNNPQYKKYGFKCEKGKLRTQPKTKPKK